jgi:hypothetical protein
MESKFDDLVRSLTPEMLEELRRAVSSEAGQRRQQTAIQLEQIHPRMTDGEREQAAAEIARVLSGAETHA